MNVFPKRIVVRALLAAAAVGALAAQAPARSAEVLSDVHEIPVFVLMRTELTKGAGGPATLPAAPESSAIASEDMPR
jgi:hypothetical protein